MAAQTTHVALLRGINVGGKNKLPMSDLTALFVAAGAGAVRTYIQSGNVVFRVAPGGAARVGAEVTKGIAARLGLRIPVVVRAADELEEVTRHNPFALRGEDAERLHVMFLADEPGAAAVGALDAKRSVPDEFVVKGREVYLCCPNGFARTKLTNDYFDRALATVSTIRNWRTVQKLVEMTRE